MIFIMFFMPLEKVGDTHTSRRFCGESNDDMSEAHFYDFLLFLRQL